MFRRAFWFTTGAAAGVWATTKVQRTLRNLTPEGLAVRAAGRAQAAGERLRLFALDVRDGMAQRENELHDALGLNGERQDRAALPPGPRRPGLPHRTTGTTPPTGATRPTRPTGNEDR